MTAKEIALHAFNGTFPDELMNVPQMLLYREIENISLKFKYGTIEKADASTLKTKVLADYAQNIVAWQNGIDSTYRIADLYKRIELATSAYRLDRTIDNADKVLEAIYG